MVKSSGLNTFLYKTLIDWVSNESVLLHRSTHVTNAAATSFHLKQESDSCFILQANPDILVRHAETVYLGCRMRYSILPVFKFYLLIVGTGFTSNNACKENDQLIFYGFIKAKLSIYCK